MAKQRPQRVQNFEKLGYFHPDAGASTGDTVARKALREFQYSLTFHKDQRVIYIPGHAKGDRNHPECEHGVVSSIGSIGNIFVKFDKDIANLGFEEAQAKACNAVDLIHESNQDI